MKAILVVFSLLLVSAPSPLFGATPLPSPSASAALDTDFLLLPAHDLEPIRENARSEGASPTAAPESFKVGDQLAVAISGVVLPEGSAPPLSLELPAGNSPLDEQGFSIVSTSASSLKSEGTDRVEAGKARNAHEVDIKFIAVPIKAGSLTIPSLAIKDSSGKSIARTNPWNVQVDSAIRSDDPEPKKPVDLKPPADLAFPWWITVLLGVIAAALIAGLIYFLFRWSKKSRAKPAAAPELPKPEDEVALLALTQLEKSGALIKGDFKTHYFRISEILKSYIGARYDFDAPECTTREMVQNLRRIFDSMLSTEKGRLDVLAELFDQLDRVKFTDHVPDSGEAQKLLPIAREFVLGTRRRPTQPVTAQGGVQNAPR